MSAYRRRWWRYVGRGAQHFCGAAIGTAGAVLATGATTRAVIVASVAAGLFALGSYIRDPKTPLRATTPGEGQP